MGRTSITEWMLQMPRGEVRRLFGQSPERTAGWVRLLALEGVAQAQVCYGQMLLEGTGVDRNESEAFAWFTRAAVQGELDALNMVGRCLENGWGCEIDVAGAAEHYHRAADQGHAWAQYNLGHLYLDGIGVGRDAEIAYRYYSRAAAQNHPRAMNLVGRCCEEGWGAPKDFEAAADWYRRSAEAGYFRGQYNWASILLKCERTEEAALWLERAAASGTPGVREAVNRIAESVRGAVKSRPAVEARSD
jgi:TPR repeat protein